MGKLSWIIQVDPKWNHKDLYKRESRKSQEEGDVTVTGGAVGETVM